MDSIDTETKDAKGRRTNQESLAHALTTFCVEDHDLAMIAGEGNQMATEHKPLLIERVRGNLLRQRDEPETRRRGRLSAPYCRLTRSGQDDSQASWR